jgi:glutathione S-transferase
MAEYQLYCFAQSGNAYRAALMLSVIGADWEPIFVDFFKAGVQRTAEFRETITKWAKRRCSFTARRSSANPA